MLPLLLFGIPVQAMAKYDPPYEELGDDQVSQEVLVWDSHGLRGRDAEAVGGTQARNPGLGNQPESRIPPESFNTPTDVKVLLRP